MHPLLYSMIELEYIVDGKTSIGSITGTVSLKFDGTYTAGTYTGKNDLAIYLAPNYSLASSGITTVTVMGKPIAKSGGNVSLTEDHHVDWFLELPVIPNLFTPSLVRKGTDGYEMQVICRRPKEFPVPIKGTATFDANNNLLSFGGTRFGKFRFEYRYSDYQKVGGIWVPGTTSVDEKYDGIEQSVTTWRLTSSKSDDKALTVLAAFSPPPTGVVDERDPDHTAAYSLSQVLGKDGQIDLSKMANTRALSTSRDIQSNRAVIAAYGLVFLLILTAVLLWRRQRRTKL